MKVNLISDTVTRPDQGMLAAMMQAEVGDDVFAEDPTVNAFQRRVADFFGMEDALFFPSGTMANQTAIKLHTQPGEQLICDHYAHVYNYEGGGVSFNSGVSCKLIQGHRGMINAEQVSASINPPDFYHSPLTSLVCVENTTNKGGGACYAFEDLKAIGEVCKGNSLAYHLDGARLWNALVATGDDPKSYGALFDTISVCFSKGLGCPVGSVLVGSKEAMQKALRVRKVFGGGMRQAGYLAAAGIYALENNLDRLKEDHDRSRELGQVLKEHPQIAKVEAVETNILIFEADTQQISSEALVAVLEQKGIRLIGMGQGKLRLVTHKDYSADQHSYTLEILRNIRV